MPRRFLVQTDFKATDSMSPSMRKMSRGFGRFATNITDKNSMIGRSFGSVNRIINRGLMVGMLALAGAAALAAAEYVNLDKNIVSAGAKFKDVDVTAANFQQTLDTLAESARDVGSDTEFSAVDAAGALDKFAMAGFSSSQSMALLRGTTDLATVSGGDLTRSVDIATDSLGAFNLVTEDTVKLEENLARVSDVMAKTTTTANTSLEELFESVKAGAPAFTAAGQQIEDFAALTGVMANSGIKGSISGTALRNVMLRLSKPTGEAADIIEKLGVNTQDQAGNFRNIIDILADFEKGLEGMGTAQRTAALATIFGARSVTGVNVLLAEGSDALRTYRDDLINSGGAALDMAGAMRTSLSSQIAILKSSLLELGLQFIGAFEEDGRGALQGMIDFIQTFDVTPIIEVAQEIGKFFKFVADNWQILISLVAGIKGVSIALAGVTLATKVFGLTLSATPVGAIITAVGLLTAAIALLILNWDELEKRFAESAVGKMFKEAGGGPFSEGFETARRARLAERQAEAGELDPKRQRLAEREAESLGTPETPTPFTGAGENNRGQLDININNNAGDNADISQSGTIPQGTNLNIRPLWTY